MNHIDVPVPSSLLAALRRDPTEIAGELRFAAAAHWYQSGALSMERAAEFAGQSRREFLAELAARRLDVFAVAGEDLAAERPA